MTWDGTAEPVSRNQTPRRERVQGDIHSPRSADQEQDWQSYTVDPYSAISDGHTYVDSDQRDGNHEVERRA